MKTLLITRPSEEVEALETALAAKGFQPISEPLLRIEQMPENRLALKKALAHSPQAILITSRQGLKALAGMTATRSTPVLCVGAATAEYAASLKFPQVHHCERAQDMPRLVRKFCVAGQAPLLYARGEDISTDIAAELTATGFEVSSVILYRTVPAQEFSADLCSLIAQKRLDGVLFFSRRTAEVYVTLVAKHKLKTAHRAMSAICISDAVAEKLSVLPWRVVHIAAMPDLVYMLKAAEEVP